MPKVPPSLSMTLADLAAIGGGVSVSCRGRDRLVEIPAADLVAKGVMGTAAILDAREKLKCSACGSRMIMTWPTVVIRSKKIDPRG